jgi:hypothetical protein
MAGPRVENAAVANNVDVLLDEFEHEMSAYLSVRAGLRMLGIRLIAAIGEYIEHRDDHELLNQVYALRSQFRARQAAVGELLERWERAEGSSEALWSSLPAMSPLQVRRFDQLSVVHRTTAADRAEFKRIYVRARGLVRLFEEMTV